MKTGIKCRSRKNRHCGLVWLLNWLKLKKLLQTEFASNPEKKKTLFFGLILSADQQIWNYKANLQLGLSLVIIGTKLGNEGC